MLKPSLLALLFSTTAVTIALHASEDSSYSLFLNADEEASSFPVVASASQFPSKKQQDSTCTPQANTMRISARHIEAGGIGYQKGYTTVEGFFAPNPANWSYMPFLDLRGHVFNDGKFAANAGVGFRMMRGCRVYGINGYYDYRNTHRMHYNQISLGLETLGDVWDFRINGYLPVGDKKSDPFDTRFDHFTGNRIILSQKFEFSMKGADAEVGFHFGKTTNWDFWAAAGPYYFIGELGGPTWGGKARIGGSFRQYLTLEFLNSYDNTFHYRPQGQITLTWPFGPKAQKRKPNSSPCTLLTRMVQPVNRQEIVVVNRRHKDTPAINPATGDPFNVLFVDNTSSSAGTFESPYPTLAQAEAASSPGDIIYVFPGNGTTMGMDTGIVLQQNQKFWGSGVSHTLATGQGTIVIPSQSASAPLMTNTTGSGITLASGNDVSGFFITRPHLHGINGTNVSNVAISDMTIFAAQNNMGGGNGVNIIENNNISNNLALNNLFITNNAHNGIYIETDGTSSANIVVSNSNSVVNGTIFSNNSGIVLNATNNSTMSALLQNNIIKNNIGNGVILDSNTNGAFLNFQLENNVIQGHTQIALSGQFTGTANVNVNLMDNSVIGNYNGGPDNTATFFSFVSPSTLIATGNHIDQNNGPGLEIRAGQSIFNATFSNNTFNDNASGFIFSALDTEQINLLFENNAFSGNCTDAMTIFSSVAANLNFTFNDNLFFGNCGSGININPTRADTLFVTTNRNTISGVNGNGINISPIQQVNTLAVTVKDSDISNICQTGILIADGTTVNNSLSVTVDNNTINGACGGFLQVIPGAAVPSYTVIANNNIMVGSTTSIGVRLNSQQADAQIVINNNSIMNCTNGGAIQIRSSVNGNRNLNVDLENNQLISNFGSPGSFTDSYGVDFEYSGTNTGTNTFTALNNQINYNGGNGIIVNASGGASGGEMTLNISDNTLAYNNQNGIIVTGNMTNAFTFHTTLSGNTANNNDLSGILVSSQGNSIFNIHADHNTLFNNDPFRTPPYDMRVTNSSGTASICLEMNGNTSNTGYLLTQSAGTFNLAPNGVAGAQAVNVGTIQTSGTVGPIATCSP